MLMNIRKQSRRSCSGHQREFNQSSRFLLCFFNYLLISLHFPFECLKGGFSLLFEIKSFSWLYLFVNS